MKTPTTSININGQVVDANSVTIPDTKEFRGAWVLNGDVIEIDWDKARADFRSKASMTRADFLNAAANLGIVSDDDAVLAALGNWPASFNAILPSGPTEQREAKVLWASTTDISRNADLLKSIVASAIPVTDEQLDAMFGYTGQ
jgi:hypothetical protein